MNDGVNNSSSSSSSALGLAPPPVPPENKISPSILLIIVILAVIFFVSGLLHLLVRYLLRSNGRDPAEVEDVTVLQGQLQQLFHLHDAGVDQSFIDALPVFHYKAIIGVKDPFDCAVCLCEFEPEDKLRLLPKCSHAFHLECIDTWLLSHSTCPLCRSSLISDFSPSGSCNPIVLILESGSESSREFDPVHNSHSHLGDDDLCPRNSHKSVSDSMAMNDDNNVVPVKLGKFRNMTGSCAGGEGSTSSINPSINGNLDRRRCFSMGTFEYIMDDTSSLHVAINAPKKKMRNKLAMSECDYHSRRDFDQSISLALKQNTCSSASGAALQRKESFSVSKIWLRPKKESSIVEGNTRRAFSFRLPLKNTVGDDSKHKGIAVDQESYAGQDIEIGSSAFSLGSRTEESSSFARRTLQWIMGNSRQNRVGSHI